MQTQMIAERIAPEVATVEKWLIVLAQQYGRYKRAGWEFVFLLRDGIDALATNEHARANLYQDAADQLGLAVHTLQNYVSAARKPYAKLAYSLELEIGHLDAVLGLDAEEAYSALHHAAANRFTIAQLRKWVWDRRNSIPVVGNGATPTADAVERLLQADDVPYGRDSIQYKDYDAHAPAGDNYVLPDAYDADAYIAVPRNPVYAAQVLRQQFDAGELATLVAELIR